MANNSQGFYKRIFYEINISLEEEIEGRLVDSQSEREALPDDAGRAILVIPKMVPPRHEFKSPLIGRRTQ